MKIVIIGSGKLGRTLAEQLIQEDHDITMVDENASKLQYVVNRLDILGIHGNGATIPVLREAGVDDADLVIAATAEDELNLLACLIAKRVGARNTIARVRNPEYIDVMSLVKQDLGLSLSINPELACAVEMSRVLKFPSMITVDTFAKGRVEILQFEITEDSPLAGMKLRDVSRFKKTDSGLRGGTKRQRNLYSVGRFSAEGRRSCEYRRRYLAYSQVSFPDRDDGG